jgi:hypothetical protein
MYEIPTSPYLTWHSRPQSERCPPTAKSGPLCYHACGQSAQIRADGAFVLWLVLGLLPPVRWYRFYHRASRSRKAADQNRLARRLCGWGGRIPRGLCPSPSLPRWLLRPSICGESSSPISHGEARGQLPRACTLLSLVRGLRTEGWSSLLSPSDRYGSAPGPGRDLNSA